MGAPEYFEMVKAIEARTPSGSLRAGMHYREGTMEAERQIEAGRCAYAVERTGSIQPRGKSTAIVFGTCPSDALRRASAPARLAEEAHDDVTRAMEITSGWDEPVSWPFDAVDGRVSALKGHLPERGGQ